LGKKKKEDSIGKKEEFSIGKSGSIAFIIFYNKEMKNDKENHVLVSNITLWRLSALWKL